MRNGRGKLDIPYLAIFSVILLGAVAASLYFFPEWRESPATMVVLVVAAIGGVVGLAANFREAFIRERADAPPAPLDYDSPQHLRNQENVCANVRGAWIDGVLRESLPERVRLELALDHPPGMLQRKIVSLDGQEPRRPLESAADIADIFRAAGRALLILGAPGSGKTVTLLELCRPVLEGAEADPRRPVPVVLNLSTWAQKQAPLADWIADEMWRQYGLNRQVTPVWLAADHLILLLDGLDEVAAEARDACARSINAFRENHGAGMVVCSRSADYAELRERLALSRAVEIQPLTPAQIEGYLRDEQLALDSVREAIARDDALRELATTPLMLNVMAVAYGGRPLAELLPLLDSEDERRAHLYDAYIARMFRRKPLAGVSYTTGQALRWLRFLAARLTERDETQFFIEDMQPDWIPRRVLRPYFLLSNIFSVILSISACVLVSEKLLNNQPSDVLGGVVIGIILTLTTGLLFFFMGFYLLFGFLMPEEVAVVDKLEVNVSIESIRRLVKENIRYDMLLSGSYGLLIGVTMGVVFESLRSGLLWGAGTMLFTYAVSISGRLMRESLNPLESKVRKVPNQGIRRSMLNGLRGGLIFGLNLGIVTSIMIRAVSYMARPVFGVDLELWSFQVSKWAASLGFLVGLFVGGLIGWSGYGGTKVVYHYQLRLFMSFFRLLPLRLVPFLDAMRERILLQRAGAHYRFIHRTLQEHVAALTDERIERLTG